MDRQIQGQIKKRETDRQRKAKGGDADGHVERRRWIKKKGGPGGFGLCGGQVRGRNLRVAGASPGWDGTGHGTGHDVIMGPWVHTCRCLGAPCRAAPPVCFPSVCLCRANIAQPSPSHHHHPLTPSLCQACSPACNNSVWRRGSQEKPPWLPAL